MPTQHGRRQVPHASNRRYNKKIGHSAESEISGWFFLPIAEERFLPAIEDALNVDLYDATRVRAFEPKFPIRDECFQPRPAIGLMVERCDAALRNRPFIHRASISKMKFGRADKGSIRSSYLRLIMQFLEELDRA